MVGGGLVTWWEARERAWAPHRPVFELLNKSAEQLGALAEALVMGRDLMVGEVEIEPHVTGNISVSWLFLLPISQVKSVGLVAAARTPTLPGG